MEPVSPAPWALTLAVTGSPVPVGGSATLTATANQVAYSGQYQIGIYNTLTGARVGGCTSTAQCTLGVPDPGADVAIYKAYVEVYATSTRPGPGSPTPITASTPVVVTSASTGNDSLALLSTPAVTQLEAQVLTQQGTEQACLSLGEAVRTNALRSSVPDATLICTTQGLHRALRFIATHGNLRPRL
jgi:hypothetical protein